jgi:tRNA G10  N-methylase Trm11
LTNAVLDNKVQFYYEIAFARRELEGLGAKFEMTLGDTVEFDLTDYDEELLLKRLAHFERIGQRVTTYSRITARNQTRSDNQYLTHWYYPYKGKYHPRLVRAMLNIMNIQAGQTVLDPFIGSGTTTLEARLLGINSIGFDVSPVCVIISKVKASAGEVANAISKHKDQAIGSMKKDVERASKRAVRYGRLFEDPDSSYYEGFLASIKDERVRDFYRLAQLIFASDRGRRARKIDAFEKNLEKMILSAADLDDAEKELKSEVTVGKVDIKLGDARELPGIRDESINAIVTSPPYSIALNYMKNDEHALEELGIDIKELSENCIGVKGTGKDKLDQYTLDMQQCYDKMYRVLKPDGQCAIVIGEAKYDGFDTKTVEETREYCQRLGFKIKYDMPKKIFGLYNTIKDETVLFLQK